ncbi:MAG: hypothetical protein QM696_01565 [Steroidobacteraceae bacterium]
MSAFPRSASSSPARFARTALLMLVLCAVGAQQWVERTHWHGGAVAHAGVQAPAGDAGDGNGSGCLLCQIVAHTPSAAPPLAALHLALLVGYFFFRLRIGNAIEVAPSPAHTWQSRGPPAI